MVSSIQNCANLSVWCYSH